MTPNKNAHLILTPNLEPVCIGTLLGDASLNTQSNGATYRLKFQLKNIHPDYVNQIYKEFGPAWIPSKPHILNRSNTQMIGFQTLSASSLVKIAQLFKFTGKKGQIKGVTEELAKNKLSAKALAYWFMDDGSKGDFTINEGKQIHLHTQGFSLSEVELLCDGLRNTLGLKASPKVNKGAHIVLISGDSYEDFVQLVDPYLVESFKYKLPSSRRVKK